MKAKNYKTFAQRAAAIEKKYPRNKWDKWERDDMLKELRALQAEAEQVRPLMELADKADAMDNPGLQMNDSPMAQMTRGEMPSMPGGGYVPGQGQRNLPVNPALQSNFNMINLGAEQGPSSYYEPNPATGGFTLSTDRAIPGGMAKDNPSALMSSLNAGLKKGSTPYGLNTPFTNTGSGPYSFSGKYDLGLNTPQTPNAPATIPTGAAGPSGMSTAFTDTGSKPWDGKYDLGLPSYNDAVAANDQTPKWNEMDFSKENPMNTAGEAAQGLANAKQLGDVAGQFQLPGVSMAPFILSGISSMMGDFAKMRNLKKMPRNVNLGQMVAAKTDRELERQNYTRQFGQGRNANIGNARNLGLNPANAYANMTAANTALQDQYGTAMGQSYSTEQNTNAQLAQQANQTNAGLNAQQAMANMQLKQQQVAGKDNILDSMYSTLPNMMVDYGKANNQQRMLNMMGIDYAAYERMPQNMKERLMKAFNLLPQQRLSTQDPRIYKG